MTLDEMYIECAQQADETISKTNGAYAGNSLITVNKFKSGINYAYKKIAKEKWSPLHNEDVTLNSYMQFNVTTLTKTFNEIQRIEDVDGNEVIWEPITDNLIECPNNEENDVMTVYYWYIPTELSALSDQPVLPERAVDHKILCYMGTYYFFSIDDDPKASIWLNLFNDGFESINKTHGIVAEVPRGMW